MINPIDRIPEVLKDIWDFIAAKIVIYFWVIILLVVSSIALLRFMDSRDFIISCDEYSTDSGITCPLK